jgi:hypothetical protein
MEIASLCTASVSEPDPTTPNPAHIGTLRSGSLTLAVQKCRGEPEWWWRHQGGMAATPACRLVVTCVRVRAREPPDNNSAMWKKRIGRYAGTLVPANPCATRMRH